MLRRLSTVVQRWLFFFGRKQQASTGPLLIQVGPHTLVPAGCDLHRLVPASASGDSFAAAFTTAASLTPATAVGSSLLAARTVDHSIRPI